MTDPDVWQRCVESVTDALRDASAGHFVRHLSASEVDEMARIAVNVTLTEAGRPKVADLQAAKSIQTIRDPYAPIAEGPGLHEDYKP